MNFKLKPASATIRHLNTRKEGEQDDKILAVDAKFCVEGNFDILKNLTQDEGIFGTFQTVLFDANGNIKWRGLDALSFGALECKNHDLHVRVGMTDMEFRGVELHKFSADIADGFKAALEFTATFKPTAREVAMLAQALQEHITLEVVPPAGLFDKARNIVKKTAENLRDGLAPGESITLETPDGKSATLHGRPKRKKK